MHLFITVGLCPASGSFASSESSVPYTSSAGREGRACSASYPKDCVGALYLVIFLGLFILEFVGLLELDFDQDAPGANITTEAGRSGGVRDRDDGRVRRPVPHHDRVGASSVWSCSRWGSCSSRRSRASSPTRISSVRRQCCARGSPSSKARLDARPGLAESCGHLRVCFGAPVGHRTPERVLPERNAEHLAGCSEVEQHPLCSLQIGDGVDTVGE